MFHRARTVDLASLRHTRAYWRECDRLIKSLTDAELGISTLIGRPDAIGESARRCATPLRAVRQRSQSLRAVIATRRVVPDEMHRAADALADAGAASAPALAACSQALANAGFTPEAARLGDWSRDARVLAAEARVLRASVI